MLCVLVILVGLGLLGFCLVYWIYIVFFCLYRLSLYFSGGTAISVFVSLCWVLLSISSLSFSRFSCLSLSTLPLNPFYLYWSTCSFVVHSALGRVICFFTVYFCVSRPRVFGIEDWLSSMTIALFECCYSLIALVMVYRSCFLAHSHRTSFLFLLALVNFASSPLGFFRSMLLVAYCLYVLVFDGA